MRIFVVMGMALMLAGCIPSYTLLKSGDTQMWNAYTVSTQENINEMKLDGMVSWTQYGPLLEHIRFLKPLQDGEKLPFENLKDKGNKIPVYRVGMTPEEVVELYRSSASNVGSVVTAVSELEPINLGGSAGYKFEINISSVKGKDFKAKVFFTERENKLYVIEFGARATHYYDHRQQFVQNVINSVKF